MTHSLWNPNQIRSFGHKFQDNPFDDAPLGITADGHFIPSNVRELRSMPRPGVQHPMSLPRARESSLRPSKNGTQTKLSSGKLGAVPLLPMPHGILSQWSRNMETLLQMLHLTCVMIQQVMRLYFTVLALLWSRQERALPQM